jgi:hypothetical protein
MLDSKRISRRRLLQAGAGGAAALLAGPRLAAAAQGIPRGSWLAGDLHCHTVLSHDVWGGPGDDNTSPEEAYTLGFTAAEQIRNAEQRGLDFLALSDHNRLDALRLPDYASSRVTLLPGYEHSLAGGHAGVFAPSVDGLPDVVRDGDGSTAFADDAALARFLDAVHARGGIAVLNHPFYGNEEQGEALAWGYGLEVSALFDAVEVWNIGWPARHDVLPFADSDNYVSLPWWEREIVSRRHVPAVGGSDSHWRATSELNGPGQPTTWVYARGRSASAVLEGIRAGRTFVAAEPPGLAGPRLLLSAQESWSGGSGAAVPGGSVGSEGPLAVSVRVENGEGSRLRLVSTGMVVGEETVASPSSEHGFDVVLPRAGWLRAELYLDSGYWMTALTSPIYAAAPPPRSQRAAPTIGDPPTYGHPTENTDAVSSVIALKQRAGCTC